jgi:hypothetical protein
MLTMIYMTRIQNMSVFLLKVNNPSVRHPVCPRVAPVWPPSGTPSGPRVAPVGHPVRPPRCPRRAPRPAPVQPPSGPRRAPPCGPRLAPVGHPRLPFRLALRPAPSGPLFGRSQGYKFAQICITLCPSCIASLKTLASLLWIHCVRPIVQGGFNFPILDYHDLHDQFNASI